MLSPFTDLARFDGLRRPNQLDLGELLMSRSFRYWTRCVLVVTLSLVITLNPAWAGRGLRGWLKKHHACCEVIDCCVPTTICVPACSSCECPPTCGSVVTSLAAGDCGCDSSSSDTILVPSAESHSSPDVSPIPGTIAPPVESTPAEVAPELSPSDVSPSPAHSDEATPAVPEVEPSDALVEPEVAEPASSLPPVAPVVVDPVHATEPELPSTDDVFGLDDVAEPNFDQPSDAELFGEPEAVEQDSPETLDSPESLDLFDSPVDPLPSLDSNPDDLFSNPLSEPAPVPPMDSDDDFFGIPDDSPATNDDLFGTAPPEPMDADDDLFGSSNQPASVDTPDALEDDLFGQSAPDQFLDDSMEDAAFSQAPSDDLFGDSEPADDLFRSTDTPNPSFDDPLDAPQIPSVDDEDDLFGTPKAQGKSEEIQDDDEVDLFGLDQRRMWRDNTGTFEVEATLAELHADHVRLLKSNGNYCSVPLRRLSVQDRAVIELIVGLMPPGGIKLVSTPAGM